VRLGVRVGKGVVDGKGVLVLVSVGGCGVLVEVFVAVATGVLALHPGRINVMRKIINQMWDKNLRFIFPPGYDVTLQSQCIIYDFS
jgi:hypothetical protein